MAITFSPRDNLKVGQRILVNAFTGTVPSVGTRADIEGAVRIKDSNGDNTHYISPAVLTKGIPYKNDLVYRDAEGSLFRYLAGDDFAPGAWQPYNIAGTDPLASGDRFPYSYPVRPLREFTVNPVIAE